MRCPKTAMPYSPTSTSCASLSPSMADSSAARIWWKWAFDGWSVKDHLAHPALWDDLRASEVERISAGHQTTWHMAGRDHEYSGLAYGLRRGLSLDQVRWELATSHRRLLDAIASASPRGLDASRYGEAALPSTHKAQHNEWIVRWRAEQHT